MAALSAWKAQQSQERLAFGPAYADGEGMVFTWGDGRPVMPDYMTKAFPKVQARQRVADRGRRRFQSSWSTASATRTRTLLLRPGVPVHIVAKRLGHKDPSVTLTCMQTPFPTTMPAQWTSSAEPCGAHEQIVRHRVIRAGSEGRNLGDESSALADP